MAESISFEQTLDKAICNSFDIKAAKLDIGISKAEIGKAKSSYFPKLQTGFNSQYSKNLQGQNASVISVGQTTIGTIQYQNLAYLGLNYDLYDFGQRKGKLNMAKKDMTIKSIEAFKTKRDLTVNIIDIYTEALSSYKTITSKKAVLNSYNGLFKIKEKLYNAGKISKIDLTDSAINMAKTIDEINKEQAKLQNTLNKLSFYTNEEYNDSTKLEDYAEIPDISTTVVNLEKTPEFQQAQLEINKKKDEIEIAKKKYLPQFQLFSSYNLYGDDKNNYMKSLENIRQRALNFGFSTQMTLFDGFENMNDVKKLRLELAKLENEKNKKVAQYKNQLKSIQVDYFTMDAELKGKQQLLGNVNQKLSMIERLSGENMVEKELLFQIETELLDLKSQLEESIIRKVAAAKKIQALAQTL
ncbi:MAG: TolC family protein [bacterium]